MRVLVVDDSSDVADFATTALRRLGHDATVVYDSAQATGLLESEDFDCLLTDYGMEGLSGTRLAALARQVKPDIKVILMTGWDLGAEEFGDFDAAIQKPFTIAQLRDIFCAL
jgi:CheY-like chemotaxis protein